ncbi:Co2+/Mg2+ efflux protein ApaG [uncultured Psychrosphaera sp.]|jgi:ApaG protein|uniref:Co2+/Mg2+ efflux protein ApaG n=1 Tax=uncultured Psychrosphaera sp. TaxID=1403522 RepID=UPI002621B675|nr:Co2+/Mg2+ efflux protein ApaG [uncultured Psychrosphaera sp.]
MTISIEVKTKHIEEQSDEQNHRFVFAYTVTITNNGDSNSQLLNRYWLITDANGKKTEVQGAGVVGEQPMIQPGKSYTYTSGCIIETPVGTMEGYYEMLDTAKNKHKASIPVFRLCVPNIVH